MSVEAATQLSKGDVSRRISLLHLRAMEATSDRKFLVQLPVALFPREPDRTPVRATSTMGASASASGGGGGNASTYCMPATTDTGGAVNTSDIDANCGEGSTAVDVAVAM
jgi:hypothetical protein